jgi:hypothetical protein
MTIIYQMSKEEIDKFTTLLKQHKVSKLKKIPNLSMDEEILALKIHFVLNDKNINCIASVITRFDYHTEYRILKLNGTIYFVNNNSKFYLLNEDWRIELMGEIETHAREHLWSKKWLSLENIYINK